jgi:hypothetical protein
MRNQTESFLSKTVRRMALIFLTFWPFTSPAQVSVSINIYYNTYPGESSYYIQAPITTTNAILTYDEVISPRTNFMASLDSNGVISSDTFATITRFSDLANAVTNGNWLFITDAGTSSQQTYSFQVTATDFTSNVMPGFQVTYPMPEEAVTSTNVTFTWANGPTFYTALGLTLHNTDYSFYEGVGIDPAFYSSWNFAMNYGTGLEVVNGDTNFYFDVNYETSGTNYLAISQPLTTNGQAVPGGWSATSTLNLTENNGTDADGDGVHFTLTTNLSSVGVGTGHTNIAYYSFEDDSIYAYDFSGHGNSIDGASYFSSLPYITNDAVAGSYACAFTGSGWLNPPTNLVAALAESFSVSLWAATTNNPGNDSDTGDAGAGLLAANADQVIPLAQTGSKLAFLTGGGNPDTLHSTHTINTGSYVHLVVTRDRGTGIKTIYVNGNKDSSDIGAAGQLNSASSPNLFIGMNTTFAAGYIGLVDEIQIYSGVLSAGDVAFLYSHPGTNVADTTGSDISGALNAALGSSNLSWSVGGDTDWFVETTNTYSTNVAAAQSGRVTNDQISVLAATVTGPGTITFYWSDIANDTNGGFDCEFYVDTTNNDMADLCCGGNSWSQSQPFAIPAGQHTVGWAVFANGDTDPTEAAYLDEVSYIPDTPPLITVNPFSQTNYPGYPVWLSANAAGNPAPTWQWYEVGVGAIADATTNYYIPTNAGAAGVAGSYYAIASNVAGSATTLTAAVTFVSAPLPPDWSVAVKSPFSAGFGTNVIRDYYAGCAVDAAGNVYAADQYVGDVIVESNFVTLNTLTAVGGYGGAALAKSDPTGHVLWAVGLTNNDPVSYSYGVGVALAPGNGAYLASDLVGTNWLGTNGFTNNGSFSLLLSRFDANGSNIWSRFIGQSNTVFTVYNDLVADASGNVTAAGVFSGTVDFGGTNLTAPAGLGGFLVQYNSNGAALWAQAFAGSPLNLAEGGGQIYVSISSTTSGSVTSISLGSLSNITDRAYGLAAVNATNGQALWLRGVGEQSGAKAGGLNDDIPLISIAGSDVFLTGTAYGSNAVFGGLTVAVTGGRGQYFARYDTNGNALVATGFGSPTTMPWASTANASGVYVSGDFDYYSYFGDYLIAAPEYAPSYLGSDYFTQPFVAKFDRDGNALWARNGVSSLLANFRGIATSSDGVWASGTVEIADLVLPAQFGTNVVYSDGYLYYYGQGVAFLSTPGGLLAKITEEAPAMPVTLLNPQRAGTNFQFQFLSQAGFTHGVLYQTNLAATNWLTYSNVTGDGTLKTIPVPLSIFSPSREGFVRVTTQ